MKPPRDIVVNRTRAGGFLGLKPHLVVKPETSEPVPGSDSCLPDPQLEGELRLSPEAL